jgi:hypothetical protein
VENVYPWLIGDFFSGGEAALPAWAANGAWLVPPVEAAIGAGLVFRPTRKAALWMATLMHVFIMLAIGPLGRNWNTVVWPWNVAMPLLAWRLFHRPCDVSPASVVVPRGWYHAAVLVLFGAMPALSLVGWWDAYLSAALYSGNTLRARIEVTEAAHARLPETLRERADGIGGGLHEIGINSWSMEELNVPPYPARRVFLDIGQTLADRVAEGPDEVVLVLEGRPDWRTGVREEKRVPLAPRRIGR